MNKKDIPFKISIDDGYCEWTYPIDIDNDKSIDQIYQQICKAFKVKPNPKSGELRQTH